MKFINIYDFVWMNDYWLSDWSAKPFFIVWLYIFRYSPLAGWILPYNQNHFMSIIGYIYTLTTLILENLPKVLNSFTEFSFSWNQKFAYTAN